MLKTREDTLSKKLELISYLLAYSTS